MIRQYGDKIPIVAPSAFVEESAALVGDVTIGENSSVWYYCVLRGDINFIHIGNRTNVQDLSVVHVLSENGPVSIGDDVTIGHRAVIHGCTIRNRVIVGIGAIVLDGAEVGEDSIVAAGTLVPPRCIIPPRSFVMGSPARVRRQVTDAELEWIARSAGNYVEYARTYLESEGGSHPLPEGAS